MSILKFTAVELGKKSKTERSQYRRSTKGSVPWQIQAVERDVHGYVSVR